jgi:hypothetical protein
VADRYDVSTALWRRGRFWLIFEPRDIWIGLYVAPRAVYVCLVPCLPVKWERRRRRG